MALGADNKIKAVLNPIFSFVSAINFFPIPNFCLTSLGKPIIVFVAKDLIFEGIIMSKEKVSVF